MGIATPSGAAHDDCALHSLNPITLGLLTLPHRLAMSSMTQPGAARRHPNDTDANHFAQRASSDCFCRGIQPSAARRRPHHTAITDHHLHCGAASRRRTTATLPVHPADGRASPTSTTHHPPQPVAPSALIACGVSIHTAAGAGRCPPFERCRPARCATRSTTSGARCRRGHRQRRRG